MMNRNLNWVSFSLFFAQPWHWNKVNPPICTRSVVAMSNLCHYTRHLHKVYKANVLTIQACLFSGISNDFEELPHLLFPILGDILLTHCLTTCSSHAFYLMSTMLIHSINSSTTHEYDPKLG